MALLVFLSSGNDQSTSLYDPDPPHLWNRLHQALFVRTDGQGRAYGNDDTDPLLWVKTRYLLEGESHERARAVLGEFLEADGHKLIQDPARRAILQSDLWTLFDWTVHSHRDLGHAVQERRALGHLLVPAIRRLALIKQQIEQLPDNYQLAVNGTQFSAAYDANRPLLPPDLFDANGPWVCLGRAGGGPVAPAHVRFAHVRSVFLAFLRLPDGREATTAYVRQLNDFTRPWVQNERFRSPRSDPTP